MSGKIRADLRVFVLSAVTLATLRPAQADVNMGPGVPCGAPGVINEAAIGPANFIISLTDNKGKGIGPFVDDAGGVWPMTVAGALGADGLSRAQAKFGGDKTKRVCDAVNRTIRPKKKKPGNGGGANEGSDEESDLYIESVYLDQKDNKVKLEGIFDREGVLIGNNVLVSIPDLYADTNNDGTIGAGDHLYGLVDLNQYLRAIPTFTLGDSFSVVNGKVAGLPGMMFSTTEPVYNPNNLDIGFDGTPFNGNATAFTMHQLASVPEPSAPLFALAGAIALAGLARRRQTKSRHV